MTSHVESARDIERVIKEVDADLVIIDSLFVGGLDAVSRLDRKALILSPNTLKEAATGDQGLRAFFWPT